MLINPYVFDDSAAAAYIAAVETADGQTLEPVYKDAIRAFVKGCKSDGIWTAIKASCILAGARTLAGALVPLVGTAPININFASGDYNRKTGLVGDGSSKYLNSNRANNADPQNNSHFSVYVSTAPSLTNFTVFCATTASNNGANFLQVNGTTLLSQNRHGYTGTGVSNQASTTGFKGTARSSSASYLVRSSGSNTTVTQTSNSPDNGSMGIFARTSPSPGNYTNARIAFYSIGESIDLAKLDTRVTALINAIAAAIP